MPESWPVASLEQPVPEAESRFCPPKLEQGWKAKYVVALVAELPPYWIAWTGRVWLFAAGMLWCRAFSSAMLVTTRTFFE